MRIFDGTPVRPVAAWTARTFDLVGLVATVCAALACAVVAERLYGYSVGYYEAGGGSQFLGYLRHATTPDAFKAVLPNLHVRAMWYGLAWACAVFACGFACLAVAGTRSLYYRLQVVLRSA
jgi:hypothetical protein